MSIIKQGTLNTGAKDRWLFWVAVSLLLNGACLVLAPQFVGERLTLHVALILAAASAWNCFTLFFYRTPLERLVGHVSVTPTLLWLLGIADSASQGWGGL
jgi:hypothetical protein